MRKLRGWLGTVGFAVIFGCSSEAVGLADYFTFLLNDSPLAPGAFAYVYIPWAAEPVLPADDPCWLIVFDLKGRAILESGGSQTEDSQDQASGGAGTYAQYLGTETGALNENVCFPQLDARFTYGGSAYALTMNLRRGFGDPRSLIPETDPFGEGSWSLEGGSAGGAAAFWPYELQDVGPNAVRLYPMEPGRR